MSKLSILLLSAAFATALSWRAVAVAHPAEAGVQDPPQTNPAEAAFHELLPEAGLHDPKQPAPVVALTREERAWLDAHPDIVLGYGEGYEPEVIVEAGGSYRGIFVDIFSELNRRLGTSIRIELGVIEHEIDRIRRRDIAGALAMHPDYARQLGLIPTRAYFEVYPAAFTLQGTAFDGPGALVGKRVAVVEGAYYSKRLLMKYAPRATAVPVKTSLDGLRSVLRGEADVFLGRTSNSYLVAKYQLVGLVPQFIFHNDPVPGVVAVRSDWPLLASILDKALATMPKEGIEALTARWVHSPLPKTVTPSPAEAGWLGAHRPVRVLLPSFPPFVILAQQQGPAGIAVDFLKLIGERTGVNFAFQVGRGPYPDAIEQMAQGRGADLVPLIVRDSRWDGRVAFSQEYVSSPRVIFTRIDSPFISGIEDLRGKTIAVVRGGDVETLLLQQSRQYADIRFQRRADDADALGALSHGDADAYVGNLAVASYLVLENGFSNLKVAAPSPLEDEKFRFGIRADWPELASLVDKGLQSMTPAERTSMLSRYLSVRYEQGVQWSQIVPWAAGALAVAVIVLTGVLTWNRVLQREVRHRTARLAESEFVARSTFDQAAVGIAHVSPAGRYLRVNRKLCELVGYSEAELLERGFPDITHPDDVEADVAVVPRLVAGEIDSDVREKRYVRKDGTILWAERSVAVAGAWRGAEPWFVVAVQDITARKQAEQAVFAYQGRLRELAMQLLRAEERERRIIAAELHDQVGQSLSAMRTLLAAAQKENANGRDARLDDVSECLRQAIRDTRNIMSSLSDPTLDRLGLSAAICEWLKAVGSRHGLDTHFSEEGESTPLGPDASAMLFRSVRELVTNVVKHARASGVSVGLRWTPRSLEIVVQDDGVGMAEDSAASRRSRAEGGFGLFSIEERMADVGGSFTIATSPGRGVRATLVAPLETVS